MIELDKSLKRYNSFGFDQTAERFVSVTNEAELVEMVEYATNNSWPIFILGGGSNIVLTRDIPGLVIHMKDQSIEVVSSDTLGNYTIRAGAGVVWHDFVLKTISMGAQGLENLSLIPGSVGAAPVQNIGAYGVEVKDRIKSVRALHMPTMKWHEFSASDCDFSYRHSFFKNAPGEFAITNVIFELGKHCEVNADYGSLKQQLEECGITSPTPADISQAVISIRRARLPDPAEIGNAGSFFHNPVVSEVKVEELESIFPDIVSYPAGTGLRKLSAAWMIDHAGFKGLTNGCVGVYEKQALVMVNLGGGNGLELIDLSGVIIKKIKSTFGIELTIEPMVI